MELENKKWCKDKFINARTLVLNKLIIEDFANFDTTCKENRNYAYILKCAEQNGDILVQCQADIDFFKLRGEAQKLVSVSGKLLTDQLKELFKEYGSAGQITLEGADIKLLSEQAYASGFTSSLGGWISQKLFYSKNISLQESLTNWQYCDRLAGFYEEKGLVINREFLAAADDKLIPPGFSNAVVIMEAILAAEQGVKSITLGYKGLGNLIQDAAAVMALKEQSREYLDYLGFEDVFITAAFHEMKNEFNDKAESLAHTACSAAIAAAAGAVKLGLNTPFEKDSVKAAYTVLAMLKAQKLPWSKEFETETAAIKLETKLIIDVVCQAGGGDLAKGIIVSFEDGLMDIFSALTKKDVEGAVRYLNFGNIPLNYELKCYNKKKLKENII